MATTSSTRRKPVTVKALWRYPVKTLAGESLTEARLTTDGIHGDRLVHVRGPEGLRTSRRHFRLLGLQGSLGPDDEPHVNGVTWHSDEAGRAVRIAAGPDAELVADTELARFDVLPLLVATDGAVAAFGRDVRRLRPNILLGGVDGLDERSWEGDELHIGDAVIVLHSLRSRCPMTTVDPDTITRDPAVLRDIYQRFGGKLALNAYVAREGTIRVGDVVRREARSGR